MSSQPMSFVFHNKGESIMFDLEHGNEFEQWLVSDAPAWMLFIQPEEKEGDKS